MYKVAIDNDVGQSQTTYVPIHDPDLVSTGVIAYNKSFTKELNKAGSFKFSVVPGHPAYDYIYKLRSTVYVTNDNELIWHGRVVSIHVDFYGTKNVTCEGALAFLSDILIKPYYYPVTASQAVPGASISDHIVHIMSLYNARCSAKRQITAEATLPNALSDKTAYSIVGVESYTSVLDELSNCLQYETNLRMCMDYSPGMGAKLTIKMVPFGTIDNEVALTKNMIDCSKDEDGSDIFTAIIPLTDENQSFDFGNGVYYVQDGNVNTYGVIERSVSIGSVTDNSTSFVQNMCTQVLGKEFAAINYPKITLTAIDFYNLGCTVDPSLTPSDMIDIGYKLHVKCPPLSIDNNYGAVQTLTLNLEEPEASTYTFSYFPDPEPEPTRRSLRSSSSSPAATAGDSLIQNGTITEQVADIFGRMRDEKFTINRHPDKVTYTDNDSSYTPPDVVQGETFDTYAETWYDENDSQTVVKRQVYGVGVTNKGTAQEQVTRLVYPNKTFIRLEGF